MKRRMKKSELVATMAERQDLSKRQVRGLLESFKEIAYKEIRRSGVFVIPDIGKLSASRRKARSGINPSTGARINIKARTVLKFRAAKAVKDVLNGKI
jgi:DNA-binding protein HU-beta